MSQFKAGQLSCLLCVPKVVDSEADSKVCKLPLKELQCAIVLAVNDWLKLDLNRFAHRDLVGLLLGPRFLTRAALALLVQSGLRLLKLTCCCLLV